MVFFRGIVHRAVEGLSFPLILALIARNEIPRQLFDRVLNFSLVHHGTPVLMPISVLISAQLVDRVEHAGMLAIGIHQFLNVVSQVLRQILVLAQRQPRHLLIGKLQRWSLIL